VSQEDSSFVKTFTGVVAGLAVFSILLGTIAAMLQQQLSQEVSQARLAAVDERIQPIGAVHTGNGAEASESAEQGQADESPAPGQQAAADSEDSEPAESGDEAAEDAAESDAMAGEQVYQEVCATCHGTGVAGAPELTQEAWADRLEKGRDTLYQHSIEGFQGDAGFMPAKGGRADLSDKEVEAAVDYMIGQVEGG
jgi:cytochrome c5